MTKQTKKPNSISFIIFAVVFTVFTISVYFGIVLLYKPILTRSRAFILDPNTENVFDMYQKDSDRLTQITCDPSSKICNLLDDSPIIIKIKQDALSSPAAPESLSPSPTPSPISSPTPSKEGSKTSVNSIAIIGDSLSTGSYPSLLKSVYKVSLVDNYAVGGSQTGDYAGDSTGKYVGMTRQLTDNIIPPGKNYEYVIVFGGVNDLASGVPLPDIEKNLSNIYNQIRKKSMKVVAVTVLPWKNYLSASDDVKKNDDVWVKDTQELNTWISNQTNIDVFIDAYSSFNNSGALKDEYNSGDGLHLNPLGHDKLAEMICKGIQK